MLLLSSERTSWMIGSYKLASASGEVCRAIRLIFLSFFLFFFCQKAKPLITIHLQKWVFIGRSSSGSHGQQPPDGALRVSCFAGQARQQWEGRKQPRQAGLLALPAPQASHPSSCVVRDLQRGGHSPQKWAVTGGDVGSKLGCFRCCGIFCRAFSPGPGARAPERAAGMKSEAPRPRLGETRCQAFWGSRTEGLRPRKRDPPSCWWLDLQSNFLR